MSDQRYCFEEAVANMKLLLFSDTQTEVSNLDLCGRAIDELLHYAQQCAPDAIIHGGDVKQHYSDANIVFVVKWWLRKIQEIRAAGHRLIILRGNHDRLSQSVDSKDWLDILRVAGAETISKPRVKQVGDGRVAFLPYTPDRELERQWAASLKKQGADVLIFHTEVLSAEMSGVKSKGISLEDLGADAYQVCLGGHIHKHQKVGNNCYFIGSPFCHDWGEANAAKGYVFVEI